jgi:hypothetical protein
MLHVFIEVSAFLHAVCVPLHYPQVAGADSANLRAGRNIFCVKVIGLSAWSKLAETAELI